MIIPCRNKKKAYFPNFSWFQFYILKLCMIMCLSLLPWTTVSIKSGGQYFTVKITLISYWNDFSLIPLGKYASWSYKMQKIIDPLMWTPWWQGLGWRDLMVGGGTAHIIELTRTVVSLLKWKVGPPKKIQKYKVQNTCHLYTPVPRYFRETPFRKSYKKIPHHTVQLWVLLLMKPGKKGGGAV